MDYIIHYNQVLLSQQAFLTEKADKVKFFIRFGVSSTKRSERSIEHA